MVTDDNTRRAEAERAWENWGETLLDGPEGAHAAYRAGFLTGDANGYARAKEEERQRIRDGLRRLRSPAYPDDGDDAQRDTEEEIQWSETVESYIRSLPWSNDISDDIKMYVAGNIRAYAAHVRSEIEKAEATGYARALADLERLAVHSREIVDHATGIEQERQSWALNGQLRALATLRLNPSWRCTDPTHTRCQEKEAGNG